MTTLCLCDLLLLLLSTPSMPALHMFCVMHRAASEVPLRSRCTVHLICNL